ncbi:MAG: hypothetical protein HY791_10945 [Deltaproteobacteria bacterium]|nr:hypothetical protein [Deltaproteobacteria bacterium]
MRALITSVVTLAACSATPGPSGDCSVCVQEKCADLVALCKTDSDCAAMAECLAAEGVGGLPACQSRLELIARPPGFAAVETCVAVACPDEDECSTPGDWVAPEEVACEETNTPVAGGELPDCGFDSSLRFDPAGSVLQLYSADKRVCARIERRNDGSGSLANTQWVPVRVELGEVGKVASVTSPNDLCWYASHHNFRDWLHVWTGTRRFELLLELYGHEGARTYSLYVFEQGPVDAMACPAELEAQACVAGPIELFPVR